MKEKEKKKGYIIVFVTMGNLFLLRVYKSIN